MGQIKINGEKIRHEKALKNHSEAVEVMMQELLDNKIIEDVSEIKGIGHRVVHAGEYYSDSVVIDDEVLDRVTELTKLVPIHHPGEIAGIKAMQEKMPGVVNVAVFDTAFHQTMPKDIYMYAVPMSWYKELGVRKYGFHGTSHKYITETMQEKLNKKDVYIIYEHTHQRGSHKNQHAQQKRNLPPSQVADRPRKNLPQSHAHHGHGQCQLSHGCCTAKLSLQLR